MVWREVRDTSQSPGQGCMASPKVHGPLMQLGGDEIVKALLLGPTNDRPIMPTTMEEEAVLLGDEQEPQEAQEVNTSSPQHPEATEAKKTN